MSRQDGLFQAEEFGTATPTTATIIFICPYGTPIHKVGFAIRRLLRAGYHVVAYETTTAVFTDADPLILPELIARIREDIKSRIAKLTSEGVTEFGFFGSSLGSFILYNCVGRQIPEFRWGVFNTGGNIAQGMWNMPDLRQLHVARGWSLPRLEEAWAQLQWPDFGRLDGCRFVSSASIMGPAFRQWLGTPVRAVAGVAVGLMMTALAGRGQACGRSPAGWDHLGPSSRSGTVWAAAGSVGRQGCAGGRA